MGDIIFHGETKDLVFTPVEDGIPQTGETTEVKIRRMSDDQTWNGAAYDGAENWLSMSEIGTTGTYTYSFTFPSSDDEIVTNYRVSALEAFAEEEFLVREEYADATDVTNIITEIDANETKIDTAITDIGTVDTNLGTHDTDVKALIGTPSADLAVDIADIDSDLGTHDTDIKALIGSPPTDLYTDLKLEIDANETKIDAIQVDVTSIENKIDIIDTNVDDIEEDTSTTIPTQITTHDTDIKADIATVQSTADSIETKVDIIDGIVDDILVDTDTTIPALLAALEIELQGASDRDMTELWDQNDSIITIVGNIQNNTTRVLVWPRRMVPPDAGTKDYMVKVYNYDVDDHTPKDFDSDPDVSCEYIDGSPDLFTNQSMTKLSTGIYEYNFTIDNTDVLGPVEFVFDFLLDTVSFLESAVSEITDYDTELAEIKADTETIIEDTGTTLPAQIDALEVSLTAEIDENQAIIETVRDNINGLLVIPSTVVKHLGISQIKTSDGNPLLTGASTIPLNPDTSETLKASNGIVIIDKGEAEEESLEYTTIIDDDITLVGTTTQDHSVDAFVIQETNIFIYLELRKNDQLGNVQADSAPTIAIYGDRGETIVSDVMTWDAGEKRYVYQWTFDTDTEYSSIQYLINATLDTVVQSFSAVSQIIDQPASSSQIDELSGTIPPGTFPFTQEGWTDESGILTEWTDTMAGRLTDDAGNPAQNVRIRAYIKNEDTGEYELVYNPQYDNLSDIHGNYRGGLPAGDYLFTFYRNGLKWEEVFRTIG